MYKNTIEAFACTCDCFCKCDVCSVCWISVVEEASDTAKTYNLGYGNGFNSAKLYEYSG